MQIRVDLGAGEMTTLFVQASRNGTTFRSLALQASLREMGRSVSIDDCLRAVREGHVIRLEDYPLVTPKEPD